MPLLLLVPQPPPPPHAFLVPHSSLVPLTVRLSPAGVLEEARYFGVESLLSRLEALVAAGPQPPLSTDHAPLTRREVVRALLSTPSEASLRFQGVNFAGADLSKLDLRNINFKVRRRR